MNTIKLWRVYGDQGDYEDYYSWTVAHYVDKKDALRHLEKLHDRQNQLMTAINSESIGKRIMGTQAALNWSEHNFNEFDRSRSDGKYRTFNFGTSYNLEQITINIYKSVGEYMK